MFGRTLTALALGVGLAAGAAQAQTPPAPTTPAKNDYSKAAAWLCWPGKAGDACAVDLTTTIVRANGTTSVEAFKADPNAPIGQCVSKNGFNYLEAHVNADPADPRTDDIAGDVRLPNGQVSADWGLHLIDAQVAMGNLVDVVGQEAKAYLVRK